MTNYFFCASEINMFELNTLPCGYGALTGKM